MGIKFMSDDAIEKLTEQILVKYQPQSLKKPIPTDILALVEKACVKFGYKFELRPGVTIESQRACGCVSIREKVLWIDVELAQNVMSNKSFYFVAAHELGHLCMHRRYFMDSQTPYDYTDLERAIFPSNKKLEIQANRFAAALLMPAIMVKLVVAMSFHKQEITRNWLKIIEDGQQCNKLILKRVVLDMVECFDVSATAAEIRLRNLGYVETVRPNNDYHRIGEWC